MNIICTTWRIVLSMDEGSDTLMKVPTVEEKKSTDTAKAVQASICQGWAFITMPPTTMAGSTSSAQQAAPPSSEYHSLVPVCSGTRRK